VASGLNLQETPCQNRRIELLTPTSYTAASALDEQQVSSRPIQAGRSQRGWRAAQDVRTERGRTTFTLTYRPHGPI
jgi:hypothetical protein